MIHLKNDQWQVDDDGLNSVPPGAKYEYVIAADRLLTDGGAGRSLRLYDWPIQLANKTWIDIEAFIAAFDKALEVHAGKYAGAVDRSVLAASYAEARRIVSERHARRGGASAP